MSKPFYITTPIYYVNDKPHVGHAYTSIAADMLTRYHKLRGQPSRLLTGTDEHGLKLERRAKELGQETQAFVDSMAPRFMETAQAMNCAYDDFIRTTEPRHKEWVQALWKRLEAAGDIYLDEYTGHYCVSCEAYYTEKDLVDGVNCPVHKKPIEVLKEQSYFFRLSKYTDKLLAHYEANPKFVQPDGRFNEVKSFVREGLRDLSVSRTTFEWGVRVPGDPSHVMYVWLDALSNYVSALGPLESDAPLRTKFWPPGGHAVHLVGKDILRFHTVYWPAFLMSAGLPLPSQIWAHGWLTVNGEKMSKSMGNFIPPEPLADAFGVDVLRYYLLRDVGFGQDGDFSHKNLLARYHGDLGNGLGNLLNRMVASIVKNNLDAKVPTPGELQDVDRALIATAESAFKDASAHLEDVAPHRALESIWELVSAANKYVDQTAPWALVKSGDTARLSTVAYTVLESLRWLSVALWPFMPSKCDALRAQIGLPAMTPKEGADLWPATWGELTPGIAVSPGEPLFPRFDADAEKAIMERLVPKPPTDAVAAPAPKKNRHKEKPVTDAAAPVPATATATATDAAAAAPAPVSEFITYEDFTKVKLKLGLILSGERVPKSDKLLKLQIDCGEATPRQILAGIGKTYEPEQLVGQRVVVVANLAPRKMMGQESQGMVLAASDDALLSVLTVGDEIKPGGDVR